MIRGSGATSARTRVSYIAKPALHAQRLCTALRLPSGIGQFCVIWTGLKDRRLSQELSGSPLENHQCRQDSVESSASASVGEIEVGLMEIATKLLTPLYTAFNLSHISDLNLSN